MLTKPNNGWSDFTLEGCGNYSLSYLDDVAFDWVEQAIHGLETMRPFCVKGFLEPNRLLCTVSYRNIYINVYRKKFWFPLEAVPRASRPEYTELPRD